MMKKNKGAILIEALIALTVAVIIITGLVTAMVSSLSNSTYSRAQTIATGYAQEYMELLRSYKDDDYTILDTIAPIDPAKIDLNANPGIISGFDNFNDSGVDFQRKIILSKNKIECSNSIYAEVEVSWQDNKCSGSTKCHKVTLRSCLSNTNYVPLP